jgi:hypothetical protein
LPERIIHPTKKRTDLMELHPSRTNLKKRTYFTNTALNLARPANRDKLKTRDHRPEQRQINSLKLRFHKLFESTKTKVILTFITLCSTAVCKKRIAINFAQQFAKCATYKLSSGGAERRNGVGTPC